MAPKFKMFKISRSVNKTRKTLVFFYDLFTDVTFILVEKIQTFGSQTQSHVSINIKINFTHYVIKYLFKLSFQVK